MKYKRIYQTLEQYGVRITYDGSGWQYAGRDRTSLNRERPLWIAAEAKNAGLRFWIRHEARYLSVTTAYIASIDGQECTQRLTHQQFCTQEALARYLETMLREPAPKADGMEESK